MSGITTIPKFEIESKKTHDKKKNDERKLIKTIQEETKKELMPNLKNKMIETTDKIVEMLKNKGDVGVNNIQIMSLIARCTNYEIAPSSVGYSSIEIKIAFDYYLDMIGKINEVKSFPPTIESFCTFLGISRTTYNNYLTDPDRKDVMDFIHSYLLGVLATSSLTGEMKEISAIYIQKTMGKVEQTQPVVIEHKKALDLDEINSQLAALKDDVIEAEFEE